MTRPDILGGIGVLGGTFDPVHNGHLAIAEEARQSLALDIVLFVPAGTPPHKRARTVTSAAHRVAMVELAIAPSPFFSLSLIEVERAGPSYSVDTLERLAGQDQAEGHGRGLVFIMSAEALLQLPGWHEPRRLLELCRLAVVPRAGYAMPDDAWLEEHFPGQSDRVIVLDGRPIAISASDIRDRVSRGRSIRTLVPPAVADYIAEHALYRGQHWRKT